MGNRTYSAYLGIYGFTLHIFSHPFTACFFSLQIASHWKLQIDPEVCLGSGVSHRKGGLQILVDKDTGDGVDGRAELEVERVERVLECFVPV